MFDKSQKLKVLQSYRTGKRLKTFQSYLRCTMMNILVKWLLGMSSHSCREIFIWHTRHDKYMQRNAYEMSQNWSSSSVCKGWCNDFGYMEHKRWAYGNTKETWSITLAACSDQKAWKHWLLKRARLKTPVEIHRQLTTSRVCVPSLQDVDISVDNNVCPMYINEFRRSGPELRSKCILCFAIM